MAKKILIVYPEMMMGGSTTSLLNLLNEMNYNKYDVSIAFRKKRGNLFKYIPYNVKILPSLDRFPDNIIGKILKFFLLLFSKNFYLAIYHKIKKNKTTFEQVSAYNQVFLCRKIKEKYDVVISFLELFANAYVNSNKVKAEKKISWIHIDYKIAGFDIKYDFKSLKKSNYIAFVSLICLEHFKELAPELSNKLIVVENIVSFNLIQNKANEHLNDEKILGIINKNCIKLLTVCRLSTNTKGLDRIFNIIKKLKNNQKDVLWCIIGGGEDDEFTKLYEKFEYKDSLILLGEKINPFPYFKYFDAFVLTSRFEGKPMVVTEALMLGLPVICTNYSSANEQIISGTDGFIVNNDEESLYFKIDEIINNTNILVQMKKHLSTKKYSIENELINIEKIID